jgi:dTDP-glucose 4,6-dehydratase
MKILVTGGLGFIGSNFIRYRINENPDDEIINVDKVTYASNPLNSDLQRYKNYTFIKADISDYNAMRRLNKDVDCIVNFAAESHVDNSIESADQFIRSNVIGTHSLLKIAMDTGARFHHISTDEVFGSLELGSNNKFSESTPYNPRNPYSATKASSDFLVRSFYNTYGVKATISNCSNNYGPYQHPEKLIPKVILSALVNKTIPIYGAGNQVRDWIHVKDHCTAISLIVDKGNPGKSYLIGGNCEYSNIEVVNKVLKLMKKRDNLIEYIKDRPGHDVRYAIETSKSLIGMGWRKSVSFENGLTETINHYVANREFYLNSENWKHFWNDKRKH